MNPQLEKVDLLYLAWNRLEFTKASLAALREHTNWKRVLRLVLYDDGSTDGTGELLAKVGVELCQRVKTRYVRTNLRSPVAIMNNFIQCSSAPWFAKIDNDVIVPPYWLGRTLEVLEANPSADLLGIEAKHETVSSRFNLAREIELTNHIGGVGLMRKAVFTDLPVANGRMGFSQWQIDHPDVVKAWIKPALPVILLDRLPFEPWASLSAKYEAAGWQRPWKRYTEADSDLWKWWKGSK